MFTRVMTTPVQKGGIGKLLDMIDGKAGFKGFTIVRLDGSVAIDRREPYS